MIEYVNKSMRYQFVFLYYLHFKSKYKEYVFVLLYLRYKKRTAFNKVV